MTHQCLQKLSRSDDNSKNLKKRLHFPPSCSLAITTFLQMEGQSEINS